MPLGRISSAAIDLDQRLATIVLVARVAESWHSGIRLPARTMAGAQRGRSAPELLSPGSAIGSRSRLHEGLGNDPGRFERAVI